MTPRGALLVLAAVLVAPLGADPAARLLLPLPVESARGSLTFDVSAPAGSVLTGLLVPAAGPLTAWAPVFSTLQADGSLREDGPAPWTGTRPVPWRKLVRPGSVVAGLRVLVRTAPEPVQTRQVQIFWRDWGSGEVRGPLQTSSVIGTPALPTDTVRIVELSLPEGAVPTGLYGETVGGFVAQVSLTARPAPPSTAAGTQAGASAGPARGPAGPRVPTVDPVRPPPF